MHESELFKFAADGMIHAVQPQKQVRKRRDLLNEDTYEDASICLTCPLEECSGERKCFLKRKKLLEKNNEKTI